MSVLPASRLRAGQGESAVDFSDYIDQYSQVSLTREVSMKTTTVSKLKASLSEYLRSVKAGEEVLVTERGRPVAKLSPAAGSDVLADHLIEMEKHGLLKVGSGKLPKGFWKLRRPKDPKGLILKAVLREREEGW
jgi:prevent-host-death family protein